MDRWRIREPELRRLLEHPRIWAIAKTLDLSYDYANLLQDARILTDVRPVFDRDATAIEAAVVSFTLRLRYDGLDGNHSLSIALNQEDVRALGAECERATKKAGVAADLMSRRASVRTIITGANESSSEEVSDVTG